MKCYWTLQLKGDLTASNVIVACAVLHNIAVGHNDIVDPLPVQDDIQQADGSDATGFAVGNSIIQYSIQ